MSTQNKTLDIPTSLQFNIAKRTDAYIPLHELYSWLELSSKNFGRWCNKNLLSNARLVIDSDYAYHPPHEEDSSIGRIGRYYVTLNTAKHLVAISPASKSHNYRQYLIDSEEAFIASLQAKVPYKPTHYTIRDFMDEFICGPSIKDTRPIAYKLSSYCKNHNLEIQYRPSVRYGSIIMYPVSLLETYFELI